MALAPQSILLTPEEYLAREKLAEIKHEFDNGVVVGLVGWKVLLTQYQDGDIVNLESVGLKIPVKDIYLDVAGKIFQAPEANN